MPSVQGNKNYLYMAITFVASFVVFVNTFQNDFTYDDFPTILENKAVKRGDVVDVLSGSRAIRQLSFLLDYKLFGNNPFGYHVENTLLHAINSVLLYRFLVIISFSAANAFVAALLFAVHPVHVEAVASIANRKELLALMFIFLSMICYMRAVRTMMLLDRYILLSVSLFFYITAILSKQTAALLLLAIVAYEYTLLDAKERFIGKLAAPLMAALLSYLAYKFAYPFFMSFYSIPETMGIRYDHIVLTIISVFYFDIKYLIFPIQLSADHTIKFIYNFNEPLFIIALSLLICYCILALMSFKRDKLVFFMLLWIIIFLLPTVNIVPGVSYFFAERYLYIPSAGYAAIIGRLLNGIIPEISFRKQTAIVSVLLLFSYLTVMRNTAWRDEGTLWKDTIRKSPRSIFAHNNLGNVYFQKGDLDAAQHEYKKTLELFPNHPESLYNLANIYYIQGDKEKAIDKYRLFLRVWKGEEALKIEVIAKINSLESKRNR